MKCSIPEISWHNRDPVLSIDIQPRIEGTENEPIRLASAGTDSHVVIWHLKVVDSGATKVEFAADLQRHQRAVNIVRFSPSGELLASGDDEAVIILWKLKTELDPPDLIEGEQSCESRECWMSLKVLRGHIEDVYDISWSPDSVHLVSGSVDNSAILWDVQKGKKLGILSDHKGFVQGVAWDPKGQYIATMSSDRNCTIFNLQTKKVVQRISKALLPLPGEDGKIEDKQIRLFHDDTLKSFCRRLTFTPDGELLITPAGLIEVDGDAKHLNATYLFSRYMFNRPAIYLPSKDCYTVAVRCCPVLFELRSKCKPSRTGSEEAETDAVPPMIPLPYRMVFAVATQNAVLIYDTQQFVPIARVTNIHYTRLTDLSWSSDGQMLVVSSTDGYCSFVTFAEGELGKKYVPEEENSAAHKPNNPTNEQSTNETMKMDEQKNTAENIEVPMKSKCDNLADVEPSCEVLKTEDANDVDKRNDKPEFTESKETSAVKQNGSHKGSSIESSPKDKCEALPKRSADSKLSEAPTVKQSEEKKESQEENIKADTSVTNTEERDEEMDCEYNFKLTEDSQTTADICETENSSEDPCPSAPETSTTQTLVSETVLPNKASTPNQELKKQPRRVQLITLSSPKSKKQLL